MSSSEWLERMAQLRVVVLGDAMLDVLTAGSVHRLCPESPVPIFDVGESDEFPGGAANVAANAAALGAKTTLLTVIGEDDEADRLTASLNRRGVGTGALLRTPLSRTLTKRRLQAGPQMLLRIDQGTTAPLEESLEDRLRERLLSSLAECDLRPRTSEGL